MVRGRLSKFLPWLLLVPFAVTLTCLELRLKPPNPQAGTKPEVVWVFKAPHPGAIISSPLVADGRVYVGAIRDRGLSPAGVVYALDEESGKPVWKYDADGEMIRS